MTGQAEQVKRKKPQMRQGCRRGLPTCPHHDWVLNRQAPAPTVIFSWTTGSVAQQEPGRISFCLLLWALVWDTAEHRGASGSTVLTRQNSGSILISATAQSLQLGWASLMSGLTARVSRPDSSHSGLRCHPSPSFRITGSTVSWGVLWKPGLQYNCYSCYWNSLLDFCSLSRKFWKLPRRRSGLCILQAWAVPTDS